MLVDFENVQPEAETLALLNDERIKTLIFVNSTQKLSVDRVKVLQPFGDRVEYVEMSGSGKNALDLMIAFYIGRAWSENPEAKFYVVSKDTGFDPLVKHLAALRPGSVMREIDLASINAHIGQPGNYSAAPAKPGIIRLQVVDVCSALQALPEANWPDSSAAFDVFVKTALSGDDLPESRLNTLIKFMGRKELAEVDQDGVLKWKSANVLAGAAGQFITKEPVNNVPKESNGPKESTSMQAVSKEPINSKAQVNNVPKQSNAAKKLTTVQAVSKKPVNSKAQVNNVPKKSNAAKKSTTVQAVSKKPVNSKAQVNNVPKKSNAAKDATSIPGAEAIALKVCDILKKYVAKPRTVKTLVATIKAMFLESLSETQVDATLDYLKVNNFIAVSDDLKVVYNLEKTTDGQKKDCDRRQVTWPFWMSHSL
ncbi:MAG: hypothetical protein LBJ64_11090 [Deltaproteobacteria bacterium]|nr:hypothetical protein [Deltaproteobacteria bacterium]